MISMLKHFTLIFVSLSIFLSIVTRTWKTNNLKLRPTFFSLSKRFKYAYILHMYQRNLKTTIGLCLIIIFFLNITQLCFICALRFMSPYNGIKHKMVDRSIQPYDPCLKRWLIKFTFKNENINTVLYINVF